MMLVSSQKTPATNVGARSDYGGHKMADKWSATVKFTHDKETPGTHVYAEDSDGGTEVIGKLYLKKSALGDAVPSAITVVVKEA